MLIADRDERGALFSDEEISAYLSMCGSVFLAAAQALETMAASEVMVLKRIKMLDLQTDGPAQAKELRELAASLRQQDDQAGLFDIAEQVYSPFGERERYLKQGLRRAL
jgi:hypothetical protein